VAKKKRRSATFGQDVQKQESVSESVTEEKEEIPSDNDYRPSAKKGRYRRRQYKDRERIKPQETYRDFQTKDAIFTGEKESGFQGSEKLEKSRKKAEKAAKKTAAARKKLPKDYYLKRVFDEKTGKVKYVLDSTTKTYRKDDPLKDTGKRMRQEVSNYLHKKVSEVEKENSSVEGTHKTEQKVEDGWRAVKRWYKKREQKQQKKVAKLEKKQFNKEVNFRYQKFLEENPAMQEKTLKKQLQKRLQKQRIKREYAKARRAGQTAKHTKETVSKAANMTTAIAKKLEEIATKNASVFLAVLVGLVLLVVVMSTMSSCGAMFSNGLSSTLTGSYMSDPAEIDGAELLFTELEKNLQAKINSIETDYPGYDEYRYNLDAISHDPFALISYLSAVHTEFTASEVQEEVESLFNEMYQLTINPTTETRTRTVTDPVTGESSTEEYIVTILEVTLTAKDLSVVVAGHMDEEQKEIYALCNETHGLTQQFYKPLDLYWYNYVSSYYGYRINPTTGQEQLHRGVDIAVPTGTTVYAAMDGTVTTATYDSYYGNYVVIEDDKGYCTKYAHLDTLTVSAGQSITHGEVIGTTGNTGSSTGSHLHLECLYNGEYYNPLFYFEAGTETLYGEVASGSGSDGNIIPPDAYDDEQVQKLMEEAAKYLGYPYVWGGSSPSTSFDCSGYVCWVFTNSGVHNLPRTTAQGIYDQCTKVSVSEAKAGDIIFFTGTYASAGPVSHVGIYCGNGMMIHCGDPIKYASINSSYWQSHFYSFGRLN
jgi:murein DD-endopeptidase MepM/ murein hydrolase activator NlpD